MKIIARALTRRNIVAIAIGVLLAGAPLVAFDLWLSRLISQQGQEEVDVSAGRAIALANMRVGQVLKVLDKLAARGVGSCAAADLEAMRKAAFQTMPIKEIALLDGGGRALCTQPGLPGGGRTLIASEPLAQNSAYRLDVVELSDHQRMIRLRRNLGNRPLQLAASIPATLLLPQILISGNPFSAFGRIVTAGGTLIDQIGARPPAASIFSATMRSDHFGFEAEIALPRGRFIAGQAHAERLGLLATGGVALIIAAFVSMRPRRGFQNPIAEMERALAAGEFVPYYQPIVDIRSGQLRGAEVLVRWRKPDGSVVLPGAFLPLAESSGLIREMTSDLMRRVCAEAGHAIGRRPALKISFNLAGQLFGNQSIVKDVRDIFAASPIKFSQVVLEVTERDPIENFTETRQTIAALQGLGVRIAIDDVGTGHSGLSYMLKLGVDIIKIDKMFVDAIGTDRNSTTIVETLVDLAHNMRMDVVAEGVENFEQVMHLRERGVRQAQGYVFAPPLPGRAFLQLVEAIDPIANPKDEEQGLPVALSALEPANAA
jgi:sensor c-di-GMP phosphodiesterase-like protein